MADDQGCGWHRLGWPAQALQRQGHDVILVPPKDRQLPVELLGDEVVRVGYPRDADVIVMQRVTHKHLVGVLRWLRNVAGVATVVDVDDLLSSVDPRNPAWAALHPKSTTEHSWRFLTATCREATLTTVSTPALVGHYGRPETTRVLFNLLAPHYFDIPRVDSDVIGWPGTMHSHPDDPQVTRGAVGRLVREGADFRVVGNPEGAGRAFGLEQDPLGQGVPLLEWPRAVAGLGIGIAPLVDTAFAAAKSWLKCAEMSACGVPWVASPRPEYQRLHRLGCGRLAAKGKDWYRELRNLRTSASLRQELSKAGRAVAAEHLRLENRAHLWLEAWSDAYDLQHGKRPVAVLT